MHCILIKWKQQLVYSNTLKTCFYCCSFFLILRPVVSLQLRKPLPSCPLPPCKNPDAKGWLNAKLSSAALLLYLSVLQRCPRRVSLGLGHWAVPHEQSNSASMRCSGFSWLWLCFTGMELPSSSQRVERGQYLWDLNISYVTGRKIG